MKPNLIDAKESRHLCATVIVQRSLAESFRVAKSNLIIVGFLAVINQRRRVKLYEIIATYLEVSWFIICVCQISWESATIGFWFTDLLDRHAHFTSWLFDGRPNVFWLTGFFNPQGFLTAMRQEITRAHRGWALDAVVLDNDVTKLMKEDISSPPSEGRIVPADLFYFYLLTLPVLLFIGC